METNKKAIFLCLEGPEAVGKSTQIKCLENLFIKNNIKYITLREPGSTKLGEDIRQVIFNNETDVINELLLFNISRRDNIKKQIIPAFNQYQVILMDRFVLSTFVYQGMEKGIGTSLVNELHERFCENLYPDLTIVLYDNITRVSSRLKQRRENIENLSHEEEDLINKIFDIVNNSKNIRLIKDQLNNFELKRNKIYNRLDERFLQVNNHKKIMDRFFNYTTFYKGKTSIINSDQKSINEVHRDIVNLLNNNYPHLNLTSHVD